MSFMIPNPESYFRDLIPARDDLLLDLEREALKENIPIVGPVVGGLLFILARVTKSKSILELGAATGYSAVFMARGMEAPDSRLVTLEWDPDMARRARENVAKAGLSDRVEVKNGDATELLTAMTGPFDLIFMDIEKEDYAKVLSQCHRLLKPGGMLVADNVAFQGADAFNRDILADGRWLTVHLYAFLPDHIPEHDGLALAVKIG